MNYFNRSYKMKQLGEGRSCIVRRGVDKRKMLSWFLHWTVAICPECFCLVGAVVWVLFWPNSSALGHRARTVAYLPGSLSLSPFHPNATGSVSEQKRSMYVRTVSPDVLHRPRLLSFSLLESSSTVIIPLSCLAFLIVDFFLIYSNLLFVVSLTCLGFVSRY